MKYKNLLIAFLLFTTISIMPQNSPKREMRGIWLAALGIDWPSTRGTSATAIAAQKTEYINILNSQKLSGMNTIFYHARPLCDALYKSDIEPWSTYITGTQGVAPSDPNYDPMAFAIDETHKRGMELHVWLNPYRAVQSSGSTSSLASTNVVFKHPDWIIKCNGSEYRFLDPGLPEVRAYVTNIIVDILKRYDVDGIHFDDYFYPYTDYGTFTDNATFAKYPNGFTDQKAWRYNNVNLLLKMINDSVKYYKPWVKFGISPSGNNSVNTGIYVNTDPWLAGTYTDVNGVAKSGSPYIDYILPQLYWTDFGGHLPEWSGTNYLHGRHFYIGHAAYRYGESTFSPTECGYQVRVSRNTPTSGGGVYFSSVSVTSNIAGCADTLRHNYYANASLTPQMTWEKGYNTKKPNAPTNLRMVLNASTSKYELNWDKPTKAADGDTAFSYVAYRFTASPTDLSNGSNIFGTTGELTLRNEYARYSVTKGNYYVVTCIDRYGNESNMSNVVVYDPSAQTPDKPVLALPANGDATQSTTATLKWKKASKTESYSVQVSTDPAFATNTLLFYSEMKDTMAVFRGLTAGIKYYWRVKAFALGESGYSDTYNFMAGFPTATTLVSPAHATTNVTINPVFKWNKVDIAQKYRFNLSTASTFNPASSMVLDTTITDTVLQVRNLTLNKTHYWRVKTLNSYGEGDWSAAFGFRTALVDAVNEGTNVPLDFTLKQNYPNPFNPSTRISFSIPNSAFVSLKVYDVLGNEVETLVNQQKNAGEYSVEFPMNNKILPSGVYFFKLTAGNYIETKKMILIK